MGIVVTDGISAERRAGDALKRVCRAFAAIICACTALWATASQAASFTAALDRTSVAAGESVTLTFQFEGDKPNQIPTPPAVANLRIEARTPVQNYQIGNGQVSSSLSQTFILTPTAPGEYNIPALTAEMGGQKVTSNPLKLTALKPGASAPSDGGAALAFLKLVLPRKEFYLGEVFSVEVQVFIKDGVVNTDEILNYFDSFNGSPLKAEGFTVLKTGHTQRRRAQLNGSQYTVATLVTALSPIKTGELKINSIEVTVPLHIPASGQRQRDPFDPFSFFGPRLEERRVVLTAEPQTVTALNLPREGLKPNFQGAVGTYTMNVTASPTNVAVGEPITMRVQISGHGNFDSLTLPPLVETQNFKSYPPTSKIETSDPLGVQGSKTFEEVLVPQNTAATSSPPISFTYFDPDQKAYATVRRDGIPLVIRPVGAEPQMVGLSAPATSQSNGPPAARDIVPNKESPGNFGPQKPLLVARPWFLALQGVPVLAWAGLLMWRKRETALLNNPRFQRRKHVEKIVHEGTAQLDNLAQANNAPEFFSLLFRLLQEVVGERLEVPATGVTEAALSEPQAARTLSEETLGPLHELFQTCDRERYAPASSSHQLAAWSEKFKQVAADLRKVSV
jgi:hypothetical protein